MGRGELDAASGRSQRPAGQRGIKSLAQVGQELWAGCDDGQVYVYDVASEQLLGSFRASSTAVLAITTMGTQVSGA